MSEYISGHIDITATAMEPIHHGAGTSGNTQILRTQEIIHNGEESRVPFISGNSLKHMIRSAGSSAALDIMGVRDGQLSKAVVDLLFSGGHLSKGGGAVNLKNARRLAAMFPILSVCGYSAGNHIEQSKLTGRHMHLVCQDNAWRVPARLADHPHIRLLAGAFTDAEFGTRHDALRFPVASRRLLDSEIASAESKKSKDLGKATPDKGDSAQMIYDFQTVKAGAVFWGGFDYHDLNVMELAALKSALEYACRGRHGEGYLFGVGAKNSVGFGLMNWHVYGTIRVTAPGAEDSTALVPDGQSSSADVAYATHLRSRKDEILSALEEAMA